MVDLGLDIADALPEMRLQAESRMVDRCTITKPGVGKGAWNETTLKYETPDRVVVYAGPCEVQRAADAGSESTAVGGDWAEQGVTVKLPILGSANVARDHVVHVDAAVNDPALVGREFTVAGLHHKTWATSRRLRCTEGV